MPHGDIDMAFLKRKIEINVLTLIVIVVLTGVVSAHIALSDFGQGIAEAVAVVGLFSVGFGIWLFLGLLDRLYGHEEE